jgi:filamentous hemagglutinin family protein
VVFATVAGTGVASAQLAGLRSATHSSANAAGAPGVAVGAMPGLTSTNGSNAATSALRGLQNAAAAQRAVNLAQQAQLAARQAAAAAAAASVPNGLVAGGLVPVANPTLAASDTLGLHTWDGANAPTQSTDVSGQVTVAVQQTAPRAVLDWETFNVGAKTTLNFDQSQNGAAKPDWVALNRVVGQLNPTTGLRDPNLAPAPSQILGAIKAQGTVLVINQNGVIFGPNVQINTQSLIASTLEIGRALINPATTYRGVPIQSSNGAPATLAQRDNLFLSGGILQPNEDFSSQTVGVFTSGKPAGLTISADPLLEGTITVQAGAQITSGSGGYVLLIAPNVSNAGTLVSNQGQVSLVSGRVVDLQPSSGSTANGGDPNIRGLSISTSSTLGNVTGLTFAGSVENAAEGLIQTPEGFTSLTTSTGGTASNAGVITATTSVSRNGYIQINSGSIELAPGSVLSITPDDAATIPEDPNSLANFKPSQISLGLFSAGALQAGGSIDVGAGSLIYAPGANIYIGAPPTPQTPTAATSQVFIDSGAVIDASGLKDVQVSGDSHEVTISPVTANDTADTPTQRNTLAHTTVTVDPRLSGVRSDGVAWVGSPLIPAESYAQQVGVTASQLMTKGGNVVVGASPPPNAAQTSKAPDVIIKPGAVIDVSGGWVTYQAGWVQTTQLVTTNGTVIDIGSATPDQAYLGVYKGYTWTQPRYGLSRTYTNPLLNGGHMEAAYSQGADAGSLIIQSSQPSLQGTIYAEAYTGPRQALDPQLGTKSSSLYGDQRHLQGAGSQLPSGGYLAILELAGATTLAGGDIDIVDEDTPTTTEGLNAGDSVPVAERGDLILSAPTLSGIGLGQLSVFTSGALTVHAGAAVDLAPGGVFTAVTGRKISIDGAISAPSGLISLQTITSAGSIFRTGVAALGDYDVQVDGQLSASGLWTNDFNSADGLIHGDAYLNGGQVKIGVAARVLGAAADVVNVSDTIAGKAPKTATDISGSILLDGPNTLIDVSAGGYVTPEGKLELTGKGGDVSLIDNAFYFPFELISTSGGTPTLEAGAIPGFRVTEIGAATGATPMLAVNPSQINARVAIGDGAIQGQGFAGGGTFSLSTPSVNLADGVASTGTNLSLDFFSKAGFGTYNITSWGTELTPSAFSNGLGGYNAVLKTQIVGVGRGQTLDLIQSGYSHHLTGDQAVALQQLQSGGRVSSILSPGIEPAAIDQRPVALNFGGLIEFEVARGGQVTGAAGAALSAQQINNLGTIRLPGGRLSQSLDLPKGYAGFGDDSTSVVAAQSLAQIFSSGSNGAIDEAAPSRIDPTRTNGEVARDSYVYLTGDLPADVGVRLAPGSVTDLSGAVVTDPYTSALLGPGQQAVVGTVTPGGTLQTAAPNLEFSASPLFATSSFQKGTAFNDANPRSVRPALGLVAAPGSTLDLAGASATFDEPTSGGRYAPATEWSSGGALTAGGNLILTGATIDARGGASQAAGGILTTRDLTLTATDPDAPAVNLLSTEQIEDAGFGSLVVEGQLASQGDDVELSLAQGFFLTGAPTGSVQAALNSLSGAFVTDTRLYPIVSADGRLTIDASYIGLLGAFQVLPGGATNPNDAESSGTGEVTFNAQALDVTGAVLFDQSVAKTTLNVAGDLRLTGVSPHAVAGKGTTPSLMGQLAVNGDLDIKAAQVYATTGSSFDVSSSAAKGTIAIRSAGPTPATPYSAGGSLLIQAANIVQDGVVRQPLGSLTLGANAPLLINNFSFAPATQSVALGAGSITSVSANGLSIPYGTTTDQKEYFFSPTNASPLAAPPAASLTLAGQNVSTASGATVDLSGGGDVFAYEFVPGSGGSRDVLSQFNADAFSSNGGYQFADHRQVYAIVPGLSNAPVAAYDPIYSSNYSSLYGPSAAGLRVYLDGGPGLAAGWYTLLPAQYAVLPGAFEVVQDTSVKTIARGASWTLADGTVAMSGRFGGLGATTSTPVVFDVKSRAVIDSYSNIVLTSATKTFADSVANGTIRPSLPLDAGRLVLNPTAKLALGATFLTTPASNGRGAEVDITAAAIDITGAASAAGSGGSGSVQIAADQLTGLGAASLLIGATRTDSADGTTTLAVVSHQITLENDAAHPLTAPEVVLTVDGAGGGLVLKDGATIAASGAATDGLTGDYQIAGASTGQTGRGAMVRVANGAQRDLTRSNKGATVSGGLTVGRVNLSGAAVLLDSTDAFSLAQDATLTAQDLTLSSKSIAFASGSTGDGLVLTPALSASLGKTATLRLKSAQAISFVGGTYGFGDLALDAPGLVVADGVSQVTLNAGAVQLGDSSADAGACGVGGAAGCGAGRLDVNASSLTFRDGAFRIYGAGGGVKISATGGMFYQGQSVFDGGSGALTLDTPYLGDRAVAGLAGAPAVQPKLAINSGGAITLDDPGGAAAPMVAGAPGASLTLTGASLKVTGVDLRATAGALTLDSAGGVTIGQGATLETPGYARTFGDSADPFTVSAPAGVLTVIARQGDIDLQTGSRLSLGGGAGSAGALTLDASQGQLTLAGTIDAAAPGGGASLDVDTAGDFDLTGFLTAQKGAFGGDFIVQTGAGDLTLAAGQTLKAANVELTADGGVVDVAGAIDVSGVNGGQVGLFGAGGVSLEQSASIAARASGYGATDTRQASGGLVELGVNGQGAISVASGAIIDVGADRTTARIVEGRQNNLTTYNYVAADQGGTLVLRAPVSGADGAESVNVQFAGAVKGADSVVLEGFRAYDLAAIAAGGKFTGVTIVNGAAVLSTIAVVKDTPNFLADVAPGTLANFIQTFDVSGSYANLGDLAAQANFHARPGVELDYAGDITLASNWNFGAGVVDVAAAAAAGLMVKAPTVDKAFSVVPGSEADILTRFTQMTYRVGGSVLGEPGVLTLKAGGQLDIKGSITDGFFTFADQTNPAYINYAVGSGTRVQDGIVDTNLDGGSISMFFPDDSSLNGIEVKQQNLIPYDAAANTPGALGAGVNGAGDPIGSAQIFPLVQGPHGLQRVDSWSLALVGGGAVGSANPSRVSPTSAGGVTVEGNRAYAYGGRATVKFSDKLLFTVGDQLVTADDWLSAALAGDDSMDPSSPAYIDFSSAPEDVLTLMSDTAVTYFTDHPDPDTFFDGSDDAPTGVTTTLTLAAGFLKAVSVKWSTVKDNYTAADAPSVPVTTVTTPNLIRTGTGSISIAAAGKIDLRNGAQPIYLNPTTGAAATSTTGYALGGAAVYTAGAPVTPGRVTAVDQTTGQTVTLDPTTFATDGRNVGVLSYSYGYTVLDDNPDDDTPAPMIGTRGVLVSDVQYLSGGGDVSLAAGGDVLGRRDLYGELRLYQSSNLATHPNEGGAGGVNFIGRYDQAWRTGAIGGAGDTFLTNVLVNPQLFSEGLGALGGGDISVKAGGNVSDVTIAADTSIVTGTASGGVSAGQISQGLITFGGGDVTLVAGGNLLGSRVDVASGAARIDVGGDVASAGQVSLPSPASSASSKIANADDTLRLRLSDATIDLTARGDVTIEGISSLGTMQYELNAALVKTPNGYGANFYSPTAGLSLTADGSVVVQNGGDAILTSNGADTVVLPGALTAIALGGDLTLNGNPLVASSILAPSAVGTLVLAAGADIDPAAIAMLDSIPGPSAAFPAVLPTTTQAQLEAQHDPLILHRDDAAPNRIYAGNDIDGLVLSVPKQTRIGAGRDIVDMVFFGQNLSAQDITRVTAGRDITATTKLQNALVGGTLTPGQLPVVQGNTFVLGGPGSLMIEAGRNLGPFLTSSTLTRQNGAQQSYGGGILAVGNAWNPFLPQQSASIDVAFGIAKGANFDALTDYYLNPANVANLPDYLFQGSDDANGHFVADRSKPIYAPKLIAYMQAHEAQALQDAYGGMDVTFQQSYDVFSTLPKLEQRAFLLQVYFNELSQTATPGPTLNAYQRGYKAVNLLFPASLGYTENALTGGTNGANVLQHTGDLDLRLATIQTQYGGDITILGPGGRVLAGSTVATAQQAARRYSNAETLYAGDPIVISGFIQGKGPAGGDAAVSPIAAIPSGYEGVLTLRGGNISTFTDGNFVLNQSRLFTEQGGDIVMWSSNGDLNAGEGPKTSANFPPVAVRISSNAHSQLDQTSAVTGAGIAALQPAPGIAAPNVYLIAPRGTVDAGAAGVRVAGNLFLAAAHVANADNFQVSGSAIGLPQLNSTVQVGMQTSAASSSAVQAAQAAVQGATGAQQRSVISVEVLGFGDEQN